VKSWYEVAVKDWAIRDEFARVWMASGGPKDAALFMAHDFRAKTTYFYFSPGAVRIAFQLIVIHGGTECPRPDVEHLVLAVGDQAATEGSC
jgi:hypothetical protein